MHDEIQPPRVSFPVFFLGLLLVAIGLGGAVCGNIAEANDEASVPVIPAGVDAIEVRDTLRVCFSERDVAIDTADCRAIIAVTVNRARITGRTYLEQLRRYSRGATGQRPPRTVRHGWISTMETTCAEPTGWTAYNDWRVERGVCIREGARIACGRLPWTGERQDACVATVSEIVAELQRPSPGAGVCDGPVDHWGGRCDGDLPARNPEGRRVGVCDAAPSSWIRRDCSVDGRPTRNDFYAVPRVRRAPRADGARPGVLPARVARGD